MPKTKPYKIQDVERKVGRVGITATSLKDLKKKVSLKWKIDGNLRIVLEEDGTEVEDEEYFATLPEQSVFVVLKPGEYWDGCKYNHNLIYNLQLREFHFVLYR